MSCLNKIKTQNLKQFHKVQTYLSQKKTDLSKAASISYPPPLEIKKQPQGSLFVSAVEEEEDSYQFGFMEYLKAKKQRESEGTKQNQQWTNNQREQAKAHSRSDRAMTEEPHNKKREPSFLQLEKYQYSDPDQKEFSIQQEYKHFKEPAKKTGKNRPQPTSHLGKPITEKEQAGKVRIENLFVSKEPLAINYIKADNKAWENHKKSEDFRLEYVLRKLPSIKAFKNNQKAIIKCALERHNIFVCMPTGGGKSLTFQVLTFLEKGIYICVMPLISLIFDQEEQAKRMGIEAYSLTANTKGPQNKHIFSKLLNFEQSENSIVVFCTPEKLNLSHSFTELVETCYERGQVKRFVIDEVHCVSTWGKDFRAEYKNLSSLKKKYPKVPILALTATVTQVVKQDIISLLAIQNCYFFLSSFNRPNLYYEVREKTKSVMEDIEALMNKYKHQSGIIYCLSRRQCEEMSGALNKKGYRTAFYHSDINEEEKKRIQEMWMHNQIQVILATIAFGMGINKPDVRFVIHHTLSKSLENYYQESGRAGRDGLFSECVLFYSKSDKQFIQSMNLQNNFSTLQRKQFSTRQLTEMIKYCEDHATCRRQFQLSYLGETDFDPKDCNKTCDNCKKGQLYMPYQCIVQGKALIGVLRQSDEARLSFSKNQIMDVIRGKNQKNLKYKLDKLQKAGVDLCELQSCFQGWKINQIESFILQCISYDLLSQKIVKNQIIKNNKESQVINIYLKINTYRCKGFLDRVETFPFKRLTKSKAFVEESQPEENNQETEAEDSQRGEGGNTADRAERYEKYRQLLDDIFEDEVEGD